MATRNNHTTGSMSVMEAVETLSSIVEMDESSATIAEPHKNKEVSENGSDRTVLWLHQKDHDVEITVQTIRDIFRIILNYLQTFYRKENGFMPDEKSVEGIKTIMVIVGEAAKKLDKYTTLFHHTKGQSVTELKEYKHLQEFYLSRIVKKIDQNVLGKWILGLSQRLIEEGKKLQEVKEELPLKKISQSTHLFVDLESVKKDTNYELFFISKEDGTRYFSSRLIRNMKLIYDFGNTLSQTKDVDIFEGSKEWLEEYIQHSAQQIMHEIRETSNHYFYDTRFIKTAELKDHLRKTLIALMLCADLPFHNNDPAKKHSIDYFIDFLGFLRQVLHSREYQKLLAYPPSPTNIPAIRSLELIQKLCYTLFTAARGYDAFSPILSKIIEQAMLERNVKQQQVDENLSFYNRLANIYAAMNKFIQRHDFGPLTKILDALERGSYHAFDPIMQENIPNQTFNLILPNRKISVLRIPSPIHQEVINNPLITEEFKEFLRGCITEERTDKLLFINLQDRTSWEEYHRCHVLEDLQNHPDFAKQLMVITLSKDTDFYHQNGPFQKENHADVFIRNFKNQLVSNDNGFFFPKEIAKQIFPKFVDQTLNAIHRVFFAEKNVLTRESRQNFIEIFYLFLQLKLIELSNPDFISLACKDGIDTSSVATAQMYMFLKLLNNKEITEDDFDLMNLIIYTPSLLIRERVIHSDRFHRMQSALKAVEIIRQEFGFETFNKIVNEAFGLSFQNPILEIKSFS